MNVSQISSVVPKPVKVVASIIMGCAALIGPVAGFIQVRVNGPVLTPFSVIAAPIGGLFIGLAFGMVVGLVIASWVFFLGYVYGDARRRNMPPILWTLVAALIPNLLGFLLYFAIRKTVGFPCAHCGQAIASGAWFCSWCGRQSPGAPPGTTALRSDGSGLDTGATVLRPL